MNAGMFIEPEDPKHSLNTVSSLPFIKIKLNNTYVNALLDSGATHDFVSIDFLKDNNLKKTFEKEKPVSTATKNKSYQFGSVEMELEHKHIQETRKFHILDLDKQQVILGMTFLEQHEPHIDFTTRETTFPSYEAVTEARKESILRSLEPQHRNHGKVVQRNNNNTM